MSVVYSNVDDIWKTLGRYGRYQLRILFVTLFASLPMAYHIVSVVFIGTEPSHFCLDETAKNKTYGEIANQEVTNMSNIHLECSVRVESNESGSITYNHQACDQGYTFSKSRDWSFVSEWQLVCDKSIIATTSQTLVLGGMCVGAMATTLADIYGRKPVHIICNIGLFGVSLAMAFVRNVTAFLVLRFFVGVFQQAMLLTVCIIWLELFPTRQRSSMCLLVAAMWTASVTTMLPFAYFLRNFGWRKVQLGLSLVSAISLVEYFVVDESLRWLIVKGKYKKAIDLVLKAARFNGVSTHKLQSVIDVKGHEIQIEEKKESVNLLSEDDKAVNQDRSVPNGNTVNIGVLKAWSKILQDGLLRTYAVVIVYSWIVNNVTYYGIVLMTPALAGDIYLNFLYGCLSELGSNIVLGIMLNFFGRKPMMMIFMTVDGACLIIAGVLQTINTDTTTTIVTALMLIARGSVAASFNLIYIYTPEVFPTYLRNAGIGVSSSASRLAGMVAPFSSYLMDLAAWSPGVIFGGLCILDAVLIYLLPETKHRELPQTVEDIRKWKLAKS